MLRMVWQVCVVDLFDVWLVFQLFGQDQGIGVVCLYVDMQGFQVFEEQLGVEWVEGWFGGVEEVDYFFYLFVVIGDYFVYVLVLVVDVFGCGVDYYVCIEFQWLLQGWCVEVVVYCQQCIFGVGDFGQCGDIYQFGQWVGW